MNFIKNILRKITAIADTQLIRFVLVGVSNTLISYVTYLIIIWINPDLYIAANIAGFITGTLNAYILNSRFVFKKKDSSGFNMKQFVKTFCSYGFTCLLNTLLLYILVEYMNISEIIAPLVDSVIIFLINFILNKFWVYNNGEKI